MAALALANLRVAAWIAMKGHCFFKAVAAWLASSRELNITGLEVRGAAVKEMQGPRKRKYQEMWYSEHFGRPLNKGALSTGLQRQWDQYLLDMGSEGDCQGTGKWVEGNKAWQDHASLHATEMAFKVRIISCSEVVDTTGARVSLVWTAGTNSLVSVDERWPPMYLWKQARHWELLAQLDPSKSLPLCADKKKEGGCMQDLFFTDFEGAFVSGHSEAASKSSSSKGKGAATGAGAGAGAAAGAAVPGSSARAAALGAGAAATGAAAAATATAAAAAAATGAGAAAATGASGRASSKGASASGSSADASGRRAGVSGSASVRRPSGAGAGVSANARRAVAKARPKKEEEDLDALIQEAYARDAAASSGTLLPPYTLPPLLLHRNAPSLHPPPPSPSFVPPSPPPCRPPSPGSEKEVEEIHEGAFVRKGKKGEPRKVKANNLGDEFDVEEEGEEEEEEEEDGLGPPFYDPPHAAAPKAAGKAAAPKAAGKAAAPKAAGKAAAPKAAGKASAPKPTASAEPVDGNEEDDSGDSGDLFDDNPLVVSPHAEEEEAKEIKEGTVWFQALEKKRVAESPTLTMAEYLATAKGVKDTTWKGYELAFNGWEAYFEEWIGHVNDARGRLEPPKSPLPRCADPSTATCASSSTAPSPAWRTYAMDIQAAVSKRQQWRTATVRSFHPLPAHQLTELDPLSHPPHTHSPFSLTGHGGLHFARDYGPQQPPKAWGCAGKALCRLLQHVPHPQVRWHEPLSRRHPHLQEEGLPHAGSALYSTRQAR